MRKINKYYEMFNYCDIINNMIKEYAIEKGHIIYNDIVDVFVGNEENESYFVDFEAKNKTGKYYRVRGNYTVEEMEKLGIIKK